MMIAVVAVMTVAQIVTLPPENVSSVNIIGTAWFTETKSVEATEDALEDKLDRKLDRIMLNSKDKLQQNKLNNQDSTAALAPSPSGPPALLLPSGHSISASTNQPSRSTKELPSTRIKMASTSISSKKASGGSTML